MCMRVCVCVCVCVLYIYKIKVGADDGMTKRCNVSMLCVYVCVYVCVYIYTRGYI